MGSTQTSSPLESPDMIETLLPFGEIGATTSSVSSARFSLDNPRFRTQQVRSLRYCSNIRQSNVAHQIMTATAAISAMKKVSLKQNVTNMKYYSSLQGSISEIPELALPPNQSHNNCSQNNQSCQNETDYCCTKAKIDSKASISCCYETKKHEESFHPHAKGLVEFNISSVGRSFIDTSDGGDSFRGGASTSLSTVIPTPETPPPNVSPSCSQQNSETFSTYGNNSKAKQSRSQEILSPVDDKVVYNKTDSFGGSWDLLELDLDFHQVNLDPSLGNIVEELIFFGDDPYGMLPTKPTEPNLLDL